MQHVVYPVTIASINSHYPDYLFFLLSSSHDGCAMTFAPDTTVLLLLPVVTIVPSFARVAVILDFTDRYPK